MICVLLDGPHGNEHYVYENGIPERVHIQSEITKVSIYTLNRQASAPENHMVYEYEATIPRRRIDGLISFYKPN